MASRVAVAAIVIIALVAVASVYFVFLYSPSSQQTTTSTVTTPPNLMAATGQIPSAYCSQPAGGYSNSSLSMNWGNLAPGTEGIQFLCVENTGTTAITLSVSSSLSPTVGRVTSPQGGSLLNGKGVEMIEVDLQLTSGVQTGPLPSFTVTIGGPNS